MTLLKRVAQPLDHRVKMPDKPLVLSVPNRSNERGGACGGSENAAEASLR
jgi:hypothetical protein